MSRIFVANDHAGLGLKAPVVAHLVQGGHEVVDIGTNDTASCDYPDFAQALGRRVADGEGLGILICGTGQGMAMAANRLAGVRAAVCADTFSAHATRQHNDANVLCMGQRVVGVGLALDIIDAFLNATFEGGRHATRVAKIDPTESP